MRDSHFAMLSKFINDASMQKRLICTDDIKKAIEKGQLLANQNKKFMNGKRIKNPISMILKLLTLFDKKKHLKKYF